MYRLSPLLILLACSVSGLGCASRGKVRAQEAEIQQLKAQIAAVKREQASSREQGEMLRNQMFVLHDRVESARTALARTQVAPPKLEVVKLSPSASRDPLAVRVKKARVAPDPLDFDGYDPSAAEAEMFSVAGGEPIPLTRPTAPDRRVAAAAPAETWTSEARNEPSPPAAPVPEPLKGTRTTGPSEDPMKAYQKAFALFQAKRWLDATLAFQRFVDRHPSHEYADNAYYWMGECYYTQGEYALAIGEFQKVPELYPGGNKVPDALLKIGLSYQGLKNRSSAERTYRQLVDAYPQSDAAGLGRQKLAKLDKEQS